MNAIERELEEMEAERAVLEERVKIAKDDYELLLEKLKDVEE